MQCCEALTGSSPVEVLKCRVTFNGVISGSETIESNRPHSKNLCKAYGHAHLNHSDGIFVRLVMNIPGIVQARLGLLLIAGVAKKNHASASTLCHICKHCA